MVNLVSSHRKFAKYQGIVIPLLNTRKIEERDLKKLEGIFYELLNIEDKLPVRFIEPCNYLERKIAGRVRILK
jgi:hypothetical protein